MNNVIQPLNRGIFPLPSGAESLSRANNVPGEFAGLLHQALNTLSEHYQTAQNKAEAFEAGMPGMSLNDVMIDQQKAALSLQLGVQVRNKLVAAYTDIMNMSV